MVVDVCAMSDALKYIFPVNKEQELLQSFIRVGLNVEEESNEETTRKGRRRASSSHKAHAERAKSASKAAAKEGRRKSVKFSDEFEEKSHVGAGGARGNRIENELKAQRRKMEEQLLKKKPKENFVDFYTDKDRAAAVSAGTYDIKESLQIKKKQDRHETVSLIPDEADISSIIALGLKEIKNANPENALHFFSKALELNNTDINALVSRSKCYLLLGEASKALQDAETALSEDKNNIRAIYQKAESLYFLGQFEQSLMFFHRGLRARPELASFRLGVQKTEECIENTIGESKSNKTAVAKLRAKKSGDNTPKSQNSSRPARPKPTKAELERRNARKLLGELCVDKEYLENLLKHPDLVRADTNTESISQYAKEAVEFLNKRQEFWRQQRPCTALPNHKNMPAEALPKWL